MIVNPKPALKHISNSWEEATSSQQLQRDNMIKMDFLSTWPQITTRKSGTSKPSKVWSAELQRIYLYTMKDPMARRCWVWRAWLSPFEPTRLPLKSWMTMRQWVFTLLPKPSKSPTSSQESTLWTVAPARKNKGSLLERIHLFTNRVRIQHSRPSLEINHSHKRRKRQLVLRTDFSWIHQA